MSHGLLQFHNAFLEQTNHNVSVFSLFLLELFYDELKLWTFQFKKKVSWKKKRSVRDNRLPVAM